MESYGPAILWTVCWNPTVQPYCGLFDGILRYSHIVDCLMESYGPAILWTVWWNPTVQLYYGLFDGILRSSYVEYRAKSGRTELLSSCRRRLCCYAENYVASRGERDVPAQSFATLPVAPLIPRQSHFLPADTVLYYRTLLILFPFCRFLSTAAICQLFLVWKDALLSMFDYIMAH